MFKYNFFVIFFLIFEFQDESKDDEKKDKEKEGEKKGEEKKPEPSFEILSNPARVMNQQVGVLILLLLFFGKGRTPSSQFSVFVFLFIL